MLLVKSVEVFRARDNPSKIIKYPQQGILSYSEYPTKTDITIEEEVVEGQTFVNEKGEWVVIGWSSDVYDALSLPFKCFRDQGERIQKLEEENNQLSRLLRELRSKNKATINSWVINRNVVLRFKKMGFWERLKFLFKGDEYVSVLEAAEQMKL